MNDQERHDDDPSPAPKGSVLAQVSSKPQGKISAIAPCDKEFPAGLTIYVSAAAGIAVPASADAKYIFRLGVSSTNKAGEVACGGKSEQTLSPGMTRDIGIICLHVDAKPGEYTLQAELTAQELPGGRIQTLEETQCKYVVN